MTDFRLEMPPSATLAGLRRHFTETYQLDDQQVELMVSSSRRSLKKIFSEAERSLDGVDCAGKMVAVCHSLKGLFLNMGEPEWAGVARELEAASREGRAIDYARVVAKLRQGMMEILTDDD